MNQEGKADHRQYGRAAWHFTARFRPLNRSDVRWEIPTVEDVSEGGCYFYSSFSCEAGKILEIEIEFPGSQKFVRFVGEVKRCDFDNSKKLVRYGIGVHFLEIEKGREEEFKKAITFFLEKQKEKEKKKGDKNSK